MSLLSTVNKQKILVLGVGNILRRDDGIGPKVIERLQQLQVQFPDKFSQYDFVDGGIDGLALMDLIQTYAKAIIVDAVNMNQPPATIKVFTPHEAQINIKSDALSTHGFGLAEIIKLLQALEVQVDLTIFGIQPVDLRFGENLSSEVADKIDEIISTILSI